MRPRRACLVRLIPAAAAALLGCQGPTGEPHVLIGEPPVLASSNYGFEHEGLAPRKVTELRAQEGLDGLLADARTERELFEALTLWARRQFEPGVPDPYPLSNGLDILADIRSGRTGGFCGQYAYLLADALKSYGYFDVRYVETWATDTRSHFLVEVWSNQRARWILLDPLHAALLVDATGEPLSTWQAHAAAVGHASVGARRLWLAPQEELPRDSDERYLELFRLPAISLRANLAREMTPWSMQDRQQQFLALRDASNQDLLPGHYVHESDRRADFSAARNVCRIELLEASDGRLLRLDNLGTCAHFWKFQLRLDGGEWRDATWETEIEQTFRTVECLTLNQLGVRGVVTRLTLPN